MKQVRPWVFKGSLLIGGGVLFAVVVVPWLWRKSHPHKISNPDTVAQFAAVDCYYAARARGSVSKEPLSACPSSEWDTMISQKELIYLSGVRYVVNVESKSGKWIHFDSIEDKPQEGRFQK
jgi:hypothetical protein